MSVIGFLLGILAILLFSLAYVNYTEDRKCLSAYCAVLAVMDAVGSVWAVIHNA